MSFQETWALAGLNKETFDTLSNTLDTLSDALETV